MLLLFDLHNGRGTEGEWKVVTLVMRMLVLSSLQVRRSTRQGRLVTVARQGYLQTFDLGKVLARRERRQDGRC